MEAAPVSAAAPPAPSPASPAAAQPQPSVPQAPAPQGSQQPPTAQQAPGQGDAAPVDAKAAAEALGTVVKAAGSIPSLVGEATARGAQLVKLISERGELPKAAADSAQRLVLMSKLTGAPIPDPEKLGDLPEELAKNPVEGIQLLEASVAKQISTVDDAFDTSLRSVDVAALPNEAKEALKQTSMVVQEAQMALWAASRLVPVKRAEQPAPEPDAAAQQQGPAPAEQPGEAQAPQQPAS